MQPTKNIIQSSQYIEPFSEQITDDNLFDTTKYLAHRLRESSAKMYTRDIKAYIEYARLWQFSPLSPKTLMAWRDGLTECTQMSPNTINRMLSAVRRLIRELSQREMIEDTISMRFDRVEGLDVRARKERLKKNSRIRISPETMRQICQAPGISTEKTIRDTAMLFTLATSGVRASEAAHLQLSQVQQRNGEYLILVCGKTDIDQREAPISQEAYQWINRWIHARSTTSEYIFTSFTTRAALPNNHQISEVGVWNIVKKYATICGMPNVKPHDFRRFVGTILAAKDIRIAQVVLGHASIETTARHYVLDQLQVGVTNNLF